MQVLINIKNYIKIKLDLKNLKNSNLGHKFKIDSLYFYLNI